MQMFANDPQYIVEDMLKGYAKAHSDIVAPTDNPRVFKTAQPVREGKVGIVTGGGSGHKPAFIGYVGKKLCGTQYGGCRSGGRDLLFPHGGSVLRRHPGR